MHLLGKFLIILGAAIVVVGVLLMFSRSIPWLGKLPGDIFYQKGSLKIYFPIVTCLVISIILTIIVNLITRR
jgi:hypothetical protein